MERSLFSDHVLLVERSLFSDLLVERSPRRTFSPPPRYNITFYSVALLTSDPELRAKQVLHLEQLGFPLPQDPSFRVSAADRKKYGKDVGNYVQNARAYDFNRMEGSPGGSSGPAMKRAKRD